MSGVEFCKLFAWTGFSASPNASLSSITFRRVVSSILSPIFADFMVPRSEDCKVGIEAENERRSKEGGGHRDQWGGGCLNLGIISGLPKL